MSSWLEQNWAPFGVLAAFVALMIASAWHANRRRENRPGPIVIVMSFYATFLSTNTFLGQSGYGYQVGMAWMLAAFVFVACAFVAWYYVAGPMIEDARRVLSSGMDLDQVTVPGYLRRKYDSRAIGAISACVIFIASILYLVAVFKGIGHIFAQILQVSYEGAVVAVFVLVVSYTSWGMIRAILHTDVVQGAVMVLGAIVLFAVCAARTDWALLADSPDLNAAGAPLGGALLSWNQLMSPVMIVGLALGTGIKLIVAPRLVVRFLMFRHATEADLRKAKRLAIGLMGLTIPMLFMLGIMAHGIIPPEQSQFYFQNTDQVVPFLVEHLFGRVWGAVILGSFLCAALSSIDSVLHVAGSALVVDLWAVGRKAAPQTVARLQRMAMFPTALLPALVALDPPADVVPMTALSGALFGGCFFPALVLSLWWKQARRSAALASIVAGGVAVAAWSAGLQHALGLDTIHPVFAGLLASIAVYAGMAMARPGSETQPRLEKTPQGPLTAEPADPGETD